MGFTASSVDKGRFTLVDPDGIGPSRLEFHFNPTIVSDTHPATWTAVKIPGKALPVYQYGGSGERVISFTLRFDGDRGRLERNSSTSGRRNPLAQATGLSTSQAGTVISQGLAKSGIKRTVAFIRSSGRHIGGNLVGSLQPDPAFSLNPRFRPSASFAPGDPVGLSIQEELDFLRRLSMPGLSGNSVTAPRRVIFNMGLAYQGIECVCEVGDISTFFWTPKGEPVRADVPIKLKQYALDPVFRHSISTRLG